MVDISGCPDQGDHRYIKAEFVLNGAGHSAGPVCGYHIAIHRIGMVHDIHKKCSDLSALHERSHGNIIIHRTFRFDDLRIQFRRIGDDRAVFHPVTAVECQRIAISICGGKGATGESGIGAFDRQSTFHGKMSQIRFIGGITEKFCRIGSRMGMCCAENDLSVITNADIFDGTAAAVDQFQ